MSELEWGVKCPAFNRTYQFMDRDTAIDASRNHDGDVLVVRIKGGEWCPTSARRASDDEG